MNGWSRGLQTYPAFTEGSGCAGMFTWDVGSAELRHTYGHITISTGRSFTDLVAERRIRERPSVVGCYSPSGGAQMIHLKRPMESVD